VPGRLWKTSAVHSSSRVFLQTPQNDQSCFEKLRGGASQFLASAFLLLLTPDFSRVAAGSGKKRFQPFLLANRSGHRPSR
jgi:hypothetical protein